MSAKILARTALALLFLAAPAVRAQVTVVNMIPQAQSNETNQDSEANLSVNPANPMQIVGSAFTPDPLNGPNAPIYFSIDGGATWNLNSILPGNNSSGGTGDVTLRFGGTSNRLYAGILRGDSFLKLNILSTPDFTQPNTMAILVSRSSEDQPYVQATTTLGGSGAGLDRVYVGNNNVGVDGPSASIDRSLDGGAAMPPSPSNFNTFSIETRATALVPGGKHQDGPPIRPVFHYDGTVYAIYYGWRSFSGVSGATTDVVVVRDDNWAAGANPFSDLKDSSDNLPGRIVVPGVKVPWNNSNQANFGQERFVGSNLSIAVDPRDSSRVYIAWADIPQGSTSYTLHVRRSDTRGASWSINDLLTVTNATNPALAVNVQGKVGFLYQKLASGNPQRWETHLQRSVDLGGMWDDLILAKPPANAPSAIFPPYLGDYIHLQAIGKDWYGVFTANNTPDQANFPQQVSFKRNANFNTHQLLGTDNTTPVAISIDPFFFKVTELSPDLDFYVRDWTDSASSGDTGLEPSTHPVFYHTSDVWNRRGTLPGTPFVNDQPANEPAGNGDLDIGDNWTFARIRRNSSGSAETVTAHFLVSKFGTGSNYVDATSMDPDVTISGPDPTVSFAANETGPKITDALYWHLAAISSTHLCLAVEISTPNDPYVAPSLLNSAPGWPTTDVRVLLDNNKAQRNLGLSTTPARGIGASIGAYAILHNAATIPRDMTLHYTVDRSQFPRLSGGTIRVVGQEKQPLSADGTIVVPKLQPGENRWLEIALPAVEGREGEVLTVDVQDVVLGQTVDGFSIGTRLAATEQVAGDALEMHRSVFTRLSAGFGIPEAQREADAAQELIRSTKVTGEQYQAFLREHLKVMDEILRQAAALLDGDPFASQEGLDSLGRLVDSEAGPERLSADHVSFLNRLDSLLTLRQLEHGDTADILQMVRWQRDLYLRAAKLSSLHAAAPVVDASRNFITLWEARKVSAADYPKLLASLTESFRSTAADLERELPDLAENEKMIEEALGSKDLNALEKAHRDFLLRLQTLDN
jgi:hypothetical protein